MHTSTTAEAGGSLAPVWFTAALADRPERADVVVDGVRVHLRCWGPAGSPGVVLIHGGAAHSGWWDHVAPLLAQTNRVVAVDLSGHGDSGRREHYDMAVWAREVLAAAEAGGIAGSPVVVGHSMGGWVAVVAGVEHAASVSGVVVIDSLLTDRLPKEANARQRGRPTRVYSSLEEAVARFSTVPSQEVVLPYVASHIAEQSMRRVEGGWTWKLDPTAFGMPPPLTQLFPELRTPVAFLRCEHGLLPAETAARMQDLLPGQVTMVELRDSGHHPMLDRPLPLVAALRTLLSSWTA